MAGFTGTFDASQFAPRQLGESHPPGKFPATITHTEMKPNKDNTGGYLEVTFQTPAGSTVMRYNLFNQSAKAVEIAHGQLSALCHATGVFKLDFQNEAAALRGAQLMIEVGLQKGQDEAGAPGYTEVKKVYDRNGNEPGKPAQAQQPQAAYSSPAQQAPTQAATWQHPAQNNEPAPSAAPPANNPPAWGAQPTPAPQQNAASAWAPTGGAPVNPPWGGRT